MFLTWTTLPGSWAWMAKVPLAMADAFKKGNLGIMDYYRMKNIVADTGMRDSIGKPKKKE